MSEKRPVIVYGVSGYTGRLVCEYLREYGVPFIAAGRDGAKVKAVVEKIPGIETADYEVAEVEHTVEALTKLFKGAKVVSRPRGLSKPVLQPAATIPIRPENRIGSNEARFITGAGLPVDGGMGM